MEFWDSWKHAVRSHADGTPPERFTNSPAALALLHDRAIAERSFRQGVVLLEAGEETVTAFLIWRGRVFGAWAQKAETVTEQSLSRDLPEFRLGWLPDEAVRENGGFGTAFCAAMPAEAEGFPAIYITGRGKQRFAACGKLVDGPHHMRE